MKHLNDSLKIFAIMSLFVINTFAGEREVTNRVNEYINTTKSKDMTLIGNMISDNAEFIRVNKILNQKEVGNKSDFLKNVQSGKFCGWASKSEAHVVDYQDEIAVAVVDYENDRLVQKEYLTLVLFDGNWEIVNSVCQISKK